jgi:hypothetical protein
MREVISAERPERKHDVQKVEPTVLGIGGALLLALAGFFAWQELALASTVLAVAGAACAAGLAYFAHRKEKASVGPVLLGLSGLVCGGWYAATKEPVLLIGLAIAFAASLVLTLLAQRTFTGEQARVHRAISWFATAFNGLAASFATYFFVFDATESSLNGFIARRSLLTLTWLVSGAVMVMMGRKKAAPEVRDAGFVVLAASMAKLLFYDLSHTDGLVRIAALALGGGVLMVASLFTNRAVKGKA